MQVLFPQKANVKSPIAYNIIAFIVRGIMMLISKRDWRGGEKLQHESGIIVVSNHISYFDPMSLAHFLHDNGRPPRFFAKSGIFKAPLLGKAIRAAGQIPVFRGTAAAKESLVEGEQLLVNRETVVIYPEGTITNDPNIWPMTGATGTARLALITKVPVVPVGQWGAQAVTTPEGKGFKIFPRKTIQMLAGDPVDLSDLYDQPIGNAVLTEATNRIMWAITALVAELRQEPMPTELWDRRNPNPEWGTK